MFASTSVSYQGPSRSELLQVVELVDGVAPGGPGEDPSVLSRWCDADVLEAGTLTPAVLTIVDRVSSNERVELIVRAASANAAASCVGTVMVRSLSENGARVRTRQVHTSRVATPPSVGSAADLSRSPGSGGSFDRAALRRKTDVGAGPGPRGLQPRDLVKGSPAEEH
jgi:hypothetical protein